MGHDEKRAFVAGILVTAASALALGVTAFIGYQNGRLSVGEQAVKAGVATQDEDGSYCFKAVAK